MDWRALLSPELVFDYPTRTLGVLSAVLGLFHPPLDFSNRYLALGSFLLCSPFPPLGSFPVPSLSDLGGGPGRIGEVGRIGARGAPTAASPAAGNGRRGKEDAARFGNKKGDIADSQGRTTGCS